MLLVQNVTSINTTNSNNRCALTHKNLRCLRPELHGCRCLYSARIREGSFSETGLPVLIILGNPVSDKRASRKLTRSVGQLDYVSHPYVVLCKEALVDL